jgi:transcription initiation factor TFIIB
MIDHGPEWRAFTPEDRKNRARTGAPGSYRMVDKGLSTKMNRPFKDASGNPIKSKTRAALYRMRKWHIRSRTHDSVSRNLTIAMPELERLSSQLGVPKETAELAALIYRKALMKRLIRGRKIEGMVAASVYLACRFRRIPRMLNEVANESRINRGELTKSVRRIIWHLNLNVPLPSARDLMPRMASDLGLEGETVRYAIELIGKARNTGITQGKDPSGIAAAAIYISGIVNDDKRTQRGIAEIAGVTEVTVRNRYKEIVKTLDLSLVPQ